MILKLGTRDRQFVGMLSKPPSYSQRHAWLFCNPYGQEAVRTAPLYRVLSERLVRAGHAVLRFDYHGCGDSSGDFADGDFGHLVDDTLNAFEGLRTYAPSASYSWFGLSLGGTVAAMAAARAPSALGRILLWQPVADGAAYCRRLIDTHRKELSDEFEVDWEDLTRIQGLAEPSIPGSVLGSHYGEEFASQLAGLGSIPLSTILDRGIDVRLATSTGIDGLSSDRANDHLVIFRTTNDLDWTTGAAQSTAVAPREVVKFVTDMA